MDSSRAHRSFAFLTSGAVSPASQSKINHGSFLLTASRPNIFRAKQARSRPLIVPSMCVSTTSSPPATVSETSQVSNTLVCTSLTAPTIPEQIAQSRRATELGADLVELRVDLLNESDQTNWHRIYDEIKVPTIVTNRASWEGGKSTMNEADRLLILLDAVRRGASHVDVELKAVNNFKKLCKEQEMAFPPENTKLILSHHDFKAPLTEIEISELVKTMRENGAAICKIAMTAVSALDNAVVIRSLQNHTVNGPCVIIAMSEFGSPSRILAGKYGGYLTFASLTTETESAPGQVDLSTLYATYCFRKITPETPLFAVLGDPIKQSLSPELHNSSINQCHLNAAYIHMRVEKGSYAAFVREMVKYGFRGFSVTIPGKVEVMDAMDTIEPTASRIGAMNTVVYNDQTKSLSGFNTDWSAAIDAIINVIVSNGDASGINGKRVISIGAGGAGRGLAFGALERGASSVLIVNRTFEKAKTLADELGDRASAMSIEQFVNNSDANTSYDVLMNTSSVGMFPNTGVSPLPSECIPTKAVVFDAIYNPLKTELLRIAEEKGCLTVSGVEMFVGQAAQQFAHWFPDVDPPVDVMREVVMCKLVAKQ